MKYVKMNYRGLELSVNPESITIEMSKKIATAPVLFKNSISKEICFNPTVISGKGCFFGERAGEQANRLLTEFRSRGSAYLFCPLFPPLKMLFSDLKINADAQKGCIEYTFSFVEERCTKEGRKSFGFTYALEGENLYDIAGRCGVDVGALFSANSYRDLFSVKEGDKVWLS